VSALATGLGLAVAIAGTRTAVPEAAWPRFWATAFFVVLLWPVSLALLGLVWGMRAELAAAGVLLLLTAAQHAGGPAIDVPDPATVRWWGTLASPGDAVRHRIPLPPVQSREWERAWEEAARAAVVVCTERTVTSDTEVTVAVGDRAPVLLAGQQRLESPGELGWYALPIGRPEVEAAARAGQPLEVVLRRGPGAAPPVRLCGARDDPARPGAGGSERLVGGSWSRSSLADLPLSDAGGRPILGRYLVELRLLDASGRPTIGIWY
jgi:hypothetical protein